MKGLLKRTCAIGMVVAFIFPLITWGEMSLSDMRGEPIIIRQNPSDPVGAPRMPVFNPFTAELTDGDVFLYANTPCGIVSVSIISTAGDDYSTNYDTSVGSILLPISGNSGFYTLHITMTDGTQFVGEFTI